MWREKPVKHEIAFSRGRSSDQVNYDHVASEYDRRYALHAYPGVLRVLLEVASRTSPAPRRALELGCGTGKWLSELERRGFSVAGIDR